jgi:hypothetical protein
MNECLNCGKPVINKYCNVSCQNKHQNSYRNDKKYGEFKNFKVICEKCGKELEVTEREKLFPQKEKYYCDRKCANSRESTMNDNIKNKIRESLFRYNENIGRIKYIEKCCKNCGEKYFGKKNSEFCSRSCSITYRNIHSNLAINAGKKSTNSQNKRSKNETYLSDLCINEFKNVRLNEPILMDGMRI